ncbi:MAG TPA: hypothetical protein VEQ10_17910 [Vicinamibacteria bacterium]|nr:hypothetical protein [Vicinamibacteria bacterium]
MRERATAIAVAMALALTMVACGGGAEKNVINQYFTALQANDTNTLTSFAMVQFNQPVTDWRITSVGAETKVSAPLPDLVKKQKDLEADLAKNTREARAWGNDLSVYQKLDQVREAEKKGGKIPPALQPIAEKWTNYNNKDRELKKQATDAKNAVEREKRNVALSVGNVEDLDTLKGDMITKDVDLDLTINGQKKPYVMTLRKYEMTGGTGGRMVSRWVVQNLTPKA